MTPSWWHHRRRARRLETPILPAPPALPAAPVAPDVTVSIQDFALPVQLTFVLVARTGVGRYPIGFDILASDDTEDIAEDGSATEHWRSAAIPAAALVFGYQLAVQLPIEQPSYEKYLGLLVVR